MIYQFRVTFRRLDESAWDALASQACLFDYVLGKLDITDQEKITMAETRFVEGDYGSVLDLMCSTQVPDSLGSQELRASTIGTDLLGPVPVTEEETNVVSLTGGVALATLDHEEAMFTLVALQCARDEAQHAAFLQLRHRDAASSHRANVMHHRLQHNIGIKAVAEWMKTSMRVTVVPSLARIQEYCTSFRAEAIPTRRGLGSCSLRSLLFD